MFSRASVLKLSQNVNTKSESCWIETIFVRSQKPRLAYAKSGSNVNKNVREYWQVVRSIDPCRRTSHPSSSSQDWNTASTTCIEEAFPVLVYASFDRTKYPHKAFRIQGA